MTWGRQVLPFYGALALLFDTLMYLVDAVWIGHYLGNPGKLLMLTPTRY